VGAGLEAADREHHVGPAVVDEQEFDRRRADGDIGQGQKVAEGRGEAGGEADMQVLLARLLERNAEIEPVQRAHRLVDRAQDAQALVHRLVGLTGRDMAFEGGQRR
jgi:hypothetical protein